jgi:uncharacterized protein (TIGR03790 family)
MRLLLVCTFVVLLAAPARAELKPDELGMIAMAASREGRQVAEHYAQARGVPKANLFLLEGKPGDTISRQDWDAQARPAIRAWLRADGREEKIRCLVTCWDVPLRIGRRPADGPAAIARRAFLGRAQADGLREAERMLHVLQSLGREEQPAAAAALDPKAAVKQVGEKFDAALKEAQQRVQALDSEDKKKQAGAVLERVLVGVGGAGTLLRMAAARPDASNPQPEMVAQLSLIRGRLEGLHQGIRALDALPDDAVRDAQMIGLLGHAVGLMGTLQWIDQQQQLLEKNETDAAFDNELSLIFWEGYPLLRWQPNLLHYAYDKLPGKQPTMMVSRLTAPTLDLALKLVDTAMAVEKTGLTGKVYLDARGIGYDAKQGQRGSYGEYDQSLRDLADRLKRHTKLDVVLDNEGKLFQPGQCPDAALYCGWYSLASYVDAFEWRPGSVGYHMASSEAVTLRDPKSKVWCNAMLMDGICATLGPVGEPYLAAFPLPDDFFPLLLTGRHTLAEVYYRTCPFSSWQMTLVGDPLYNPFKTKPPLGDDALPERMKQAPAAPGTAAPGQE